MEAEMKRIKVHVHKAFSHAPDGISILPVGTGTQELPESTAHYALRKGYAREVSALVEAAKDATKAAPENKDATKAAPENKDATKAKAKKGGKK